MKLNAIAESCNEVVTEITETGKILDLGCNTGYLTSFYSKVFKESHLYGFDVCQKSILKAKQINLSSD